MLCRLLASLGAADPSTGKPRDFFAWLGSVGKGAASSGRLQLFLLTHRGATFAVRETRGGLMPCHLRVSMTQCTGCACWHVSAWCPGPCTAALLGRHRPEAS